MSKKWFVRAAAAALLVTLSAGACSSDSDEETTSSDTTAAEADASDAGAQDGGGAALSGTIAIDGSSTVAPLTEAIAEEFAQEQSDVTVSVGTSGTGGGMKLFCAGDIDIADASRGIKDEEAAACESAGIEYEEFRVGLDGLAVVTSASNDFLKCLSLEQLAMLFTADNPASTWNQVDPSFPAEDVVTFAPGTDSGTYDFFVEKTLGDQKDEANPRPRGQGDNITFSEDDNVLVQGIEGETNSWGFFGLAYFTENSDQLTDIAVSEETGGECVEPTDETVLSGDYPLSRPLYIYVTKTALERPEVKAFVTSYLELTPDLISEVGYVAAPEGDYADGLARLG